MTDELTPAPLSAAEIADTREFAANIIPMTPRTSEQELLHTTACVSMRFVATIEARDAEIAALKGSLLVERGARKDLTAIAMGVRRKLECAATPDRQAIFAMCKDLRKAIKKFGVSA